uniref:LRAT domain-containing protein n=1 Tax=Eptatretus burgeri TaxID=7764 RepID=A0A8C4RDA8_EPTBU
MERGDVICVRHGYFQPTHCGVYVGEGHVVHMVAPNIFPCFMFCGSCPAVSCSCVQRDTIQSFQKGKEITVVRSWVLKPLSDEEIVRRCEKRVGDMIKFDPANYNCQHFANEMRYGQPVSYQVQATSAVGGAVLGSVAFVGGLAVAPALGVVAVGSAATYYIGSAISSKWSNCCRQRNKENVKQE